MTSANVFNWAAVNAGQSLNANAANSGSKTGTSDVTSLFASMMSPNYSATSNLASSAGTNISSVEANESNLESVNAYESYSYKKQTIAKSSENPIADKVEELSDTLNDFEEKITKEVADILGVDEDQVTEAMELLGLTVFDLMNPQNLVQLTMELTGSAEASELLFQPEFMELMKSINSAAEELMQKMAVPMNELNQVVDQINTFVQNGQNVGEYSELLAQMEAVNESSEDLKLVNLNQEESDLEVLEPEDEFGEGYFATEEEMELDTLRFFAEEEPEVDDGYEDWEDAIDTDEELELEFADVEEEMDLDDSEDDFFEDDESSLFDQNGGKRMFSSNPSEQVSGMQQISNEMNAQAITEATPVEDSYVSINTFDILEQVIEKMKVSVTDKISSMEMELHPASLGKVYLQISSEEGEINAKIMASNAAVRTVLEVQMAELRDQMNQAGMKVNAIEVTVASHEFEKNLEQGQGQEQNREENANQNMARRRNLNMSSLDELMGLMSEEEELAAQIMRDNGNSVDLSA